MDPQIVGGWEGSPIYDPVRDRMLVFFGYGASQVHGDVWALSLSGAPVWTRLTPTGTPPDPRSGQSAIYDPLRDRVVIFGGQASMTCYSDVWALSLAGTPSWTQLAPAGDSPSPRAGHSAIYDPVRDRMIVFGGSELYGGGDDDVWALSLAGTQPAWAELTLAVSDTMPGTMAFHFATYDPVRDRMLVMDPYATGVWSLSLAGEPAWARLRPTGTPPSAPSGGSATYDSAHDRIVLLGNYSAGVWALTLAGSPAWTSLAPTGDPPSPRSGPCMLYDPVRDRVVVYAGGSGNINLNNDVWQLAPAIDPAWTQLLPQTNVATSARCLHSAVFDPAQDRMVVFAGIDASFSPLNDVWTLSSSGWTPWWPAGTAPGPRFAHSAICDPVGDRMIVFGGTDGFTDLNDLWALSLTGTPTWTPIDPAGAPPDPRDGHTAIYDPVRERMLVFGGQACSNDVWALSLAGTPAWTTLAPAGTPPTARHDHTAIYDPVGDRMVVFGGWDASGGRNDVWALSLAGTPAWTELAPSGTPPVVRGGHSAAYDLLRHRMVVFGGEDELGYALDDLWALSMAGPPAWTSLAPGGTGPCERYYHSAVYDPALDRMMVFGGYDPTEILSGAWALAWGAPAAVGAPGAPWIGALRPPAPNPFRGSTTVSYSVAGGGPVEIGVYDLSGRLVHGLVRGETATRTGTVVWNGTSDSGARLGPGIYFVRLLAPGIQAARKVVLLR